MRLIFLLILLSVLSCGNSSSGGSHSSIEKQQEEQITPSGDKTYLATLRPLNNTVSGFIPSGQTEVRYIGQIIQVKTQLEDDASVVHIQNLHNGSACPTMSDDTNGDGYIDEVEMLESTQDILFPMDSNLSSLTEGNFLRGGPFIYSNSVKYSVLMNELQKDSLNLEGRVVVVHGVYASANLPSTVATTNGRAINLSLPMACGVLHLSP